MHRRLRVNRSTRRHDGSVLESSVEFVILLKTDYGSAEGAEGAEVRYYVEVMEVRKGAEGGRRSSMT